MIHYNNVYKEHEYIISVTDVRFLFDDGQEKTKMAKTKITRQRRELSEDQIAELKELRQKANEIRNRGSFNGFYDMLRKGSVAIRYGKETDEVKKSALRDLIDEVIESMDEVADK